jgi:hypothetical protein
MRKPNISDWSRGLGQRLFAAALVLTTSAALQAADVVVSGVLKRQFYSGASRAQVAGGTATLTRTTSLTVAEGPTNEADNYSARISGWFKPATGGNYIFLVAADDDTDLYVSTDATPANKRLVAQETGWSGVRRWDGANDGVGTQKRSDSFSPDAGVTTPFAAGIPLTAGSSYYIEAIHHEGGGGDNVAFTAIKVGDAFPADGDPSVLTGNVIAASFVNPTALTIATDPANTTVTETVTATFSVGIATDSELQPTYQWRRNGVDIPGATGRTYSFQTALADNGAKFSVRVSTPALTGLTVLTATSAEATLTVEAAIEIVGSLKEERFPGASRAQVNNGSAGSPAATLLINKFETAQGIADNYSRKVSGFFKPTTTGSYAFFVAGDDDCDLFISTDEKPANKRLIAQQNTWGNNLEWLTAEGGAKADGADVTQKRSDFWSPDAGVTTPFANGISLVAGRKYYIEGVHHEGGGGDNFSATFKLIADVDPDNGTASAFTGNIISTLVPRGDITIGTQPVAQTAVEGRSAKFTAAATATGVVAPTYQWQRAESGSAVFADVAGATAASYTTPLTALADNGAKYRAKINAPGTEKFTDVVALTVIPDTFAPVIASVGALRHDNSVEVGIIFDEALNTASSLALANFSLSSGTVTGAKYIENSSGVTSLERGVVLSTTGLTPGSTYTLTVNNITDLKGNKSSSTAVQFTVQRLTWAALGNEVPELPASAIGVGANGGNVQSGGAAFWNTQDDVTFAYEEVTGDFDKVVQLEYEDPSSNWARFGLSVRESLGASETAASRHQSVHAPAPTRADGAASNNSYETNRRLSTGGATSSSNAGGNPKFPNAWVRLRREGSVIHMYRSDDGATWIQLGRTDFLAEGDQVELPAKLLVGVVYGPESGNNAEAFRAVWTGRFRNYGDFKPSKPAGKQNYSIGVSFGNDETRGSIGPKEIAGVDAVAQANWNGVNLSKSADLPAAPVIKADAKGVASTVSTTVEWDSPNTWASTGRGEENNVLTGSDYNLMAGYLDTGNATTTRVTVQGLPSQLTSGKYDLVVYTLGGVANRGGAFRVTDLAGTVISDYVVFTSPANLASYKEAVNTTPNVASEGNYVVFRGLSAANVIIEGTTENGLGQGGTPRASLNAIQFVSPTGLLNVVAVKPEVSLARTGDGATLTFKGTLQVSDTLNGTYTDVVGATSPRVITTADAQKFYRARQ